MVPLAGPAVPEMVPLAGPAVPEMAPLADPVLVTTPLAGPVAVAENETEFTVKIRRTRKQTRTQEQSPDSPPSVEVTTRTDARPRKVEKPEGSQNPDLTAVAAIQYKRDLSVKAWVLQNARGVCECCKKDAPFFYSDGLPYLEVHHVRQLREGGSDTVSNAVALCPNCHKELHFGAKKNKLVIDLYETVSRLLQE
jgi:predicted HNH restriction endonuclease